MRHALALAALLTLPLRAPAEEAPPTARGSTGSPRADDSASSSRPAAPAEEAAAAPVAAAPSPDVSDLVAKARALKLAEDPGWLRLGHWRKGILGWKSEADGDEFFTAKGGQRDPSAELEATLAALFDARPRKEELDDPYCRFPGRVLYLRAKLGIDEARLPPRPCPKLQEFRARVAPDSATLVFSSYYLNNPSSSFGHTLIRLNRDRNATPWPAAPRAELLDYGVNYAATMNTKNPVIYAIKGLFGGFRGDFTHYAYYYKVREYSDAESRDLWEYDLALAPDEVQLLVAHIWELAATRFQYWYLDENCAYHMLTMLEAAAPRLNLISRLGPVVVPPDTVKALFFEPGLVTAVHFRPSILTQFRARIAPLSSAALDAVEALASDPEAPIPESLGAERAGILDAALDHLDLWAFKDLALDADPAAARRRQRLLERRAALGIPSVPLAIPPPEDVAPERGHGSYRLGLGGGATRSLGPIMNLELRLALHDLADPPTGYPEVAAMEFLPVRLRIAARERKVELDHLYGIRVVSLNDFNRFDRRPSYRFRLGFETVRDAGGDGTTTFVGSFGGAFSKLGLLGGVADVYAGADADLHAWPGLEGIRGSGWRIGLGPSGILRLRLGRRVALVGEADWRWLPEASPRETWRFAAEGRFHATNELSIAVQARRAPRDEVVQLALYSYF